MTHAEASARANSTNPPEARKISIAQSIQADQEKARMTRLKTLLAAQPG